MNRLFRIGFAGFLSLFTLAAAGLVRAQQAAGPLAPEKYKDIQVLKDVPADQIDVLMRYFVASTGIQCQSCHMRDQATGKLVYEAENNNKDTARGMIRLVLAVNANAEAYGARINCATCHAGRSQPIGLPAAVMMTPEQIAAAAAQAARQGGPGGEAGRGAARGVPPGGQAGPGGRGNQTPAPPVDDVLNAYIEGLGGQAALEKIQTRVITGTYRNRADQTVPFTIEEKGAKFRETAQVPNRPVTVGFDGQAGWVQAGTSVEDIDGFALAFLTRLNDLPRLQHFKDRYDNLQAGRPTRLTLAPGATPIAVNLVQGVPSPNVQERFYFDAATGLLVRRQIITRTPLNGVMSEVFDYSDYKAVNGVMMPFTIKRNNWNMLDVLTVTDVKVNTAIDDARFEKPRAQ